LWNRWCRKGLKGEIEVNRKGENNFESKRRERRQSNRWRNRMGEQVKGQAVYVRMKERERVVGNKESLWSGGSYEKYYR